jgi:hypothetical protein
MRKKGGATVVLVGKFFFIEAIRSTRMPFAGCWPDRRAGIAGYQASSISSY